MINDKHKNSTAPQVIDNIANWHKDRNLIEGATTWTQTKKLLEEFIELVAAQMPEQSTAAIAKQTHDWVDELLAGGRIKSVCEEDAHDALIDSIGDQGVVAINICEREGVPYAYALHGSYLEIKDRKGKRIDGCFYKEEDLDDAGNIKKSV